MGQQNRKVRNKEESHGHAEQEEAQSGKAVETEWLFESEQLWQDLYVAISAEGESQKLRVTVECQACGLKVSWS